MLGTLNGILATAAPSQQTEPFHIVELLCKRFPTFVRQLATRGRKRQPMLVSDEYDVQYLLLALLRLHFDDVRPEEWTPSYAGGSARMDFLLKQEQIVVETKMSRNNLRHREVGDELLIDIQRYATHPDCRTLACFIYDPGHFIDNPRGLERDLSGDRERIKVAVWISPASM